MSEHITHIAIFEDTQRLIRHFEEFNQAFKDSLQEAPDAGLMASGTRGNHLFAVPIIEKVRETWDRRQPGDGQATQLAAAIGWLSHRAIDLQVKPNYLQNDDISELRYSPTEHQIYCDAVSLDKVYQRGEMPSCSPHVFLSEATLAPHMQGHPGAQYVNVAGTEPLFCALIQRQLLGLRAFNQKAETPEAWLEQLPQHYQDLSENLETYIEAFSQPDPLKMQTYIHGWNFYDEKDPLIRLVRDLQHAGTTQVPLEEALEAAEDQSHYAQGLRRSVMFIRGAQAFFEKRIDKETAYDRVNIFNEKHRL